jgi:hypothetical protein
MRDFVFLNCTNMKIAIPSNDGLTICPEFGQARGFLVLTSELGEITGEEMRWNISGNPISQNNEFPEPACDCQVVMVNAIGADDRDLLLRNKKEIVHTSEQIITNAWVHYLETILRREANSCCCP